MPGGPPAREALIRALGHLEELAREEYGATLNELLDDDEPVEGGGPARGLEPGPAVTAAKASENVPSAHPGQPPEQVERPLGTGGGHGPE
ncbi:hypothetical protein, partial [Streptosporangium sandarakinum]